MSDETRQPEQPPTGASPAPDDSDQTAPETATAPSPSAGGDTTEQDPAPSTEPAGQPGEQDTALPADERALMGSAVAQPNPYEGGDRQDDEA